jgi:hypothetical protein
MSSAKKLDFLLFRKMISPYETEKNTVSKLKLAAVHSDIRTRRLSTGK